MARGKYCSSYACELFLSSLNEMKCKTTGKSTCMFIARADLCVVSHHKCTVHILDVIALGDLTMSLCVCLGGCLQIHLIIVFSLWRLCK